MPILIIYVAMIQSTKTLYSGVLVWGANIMALIILGSESSVTIQ